jgi:hypothetical protein
MCSSRLTQVKFSGIKGTGFFSIVVVLGIKLRALIYSGQYGWQFGYITMEKATQKTMKV